ncbi:MAG: hypothetical protein IH940_10025 [Acidobacteria bacterium]|nr:hypothetical protein [Acidobacteriota bacterium]
MSKASSATGSTGVSIGTAGAGVIATVGADATLGLSATGLCCRPILHRGSGWQWLAEEQSTQHFIDCGVVVENRYFNGGLRIVSHAEQVGEGSVVVLDAHNEGDTPFGLGWVLSGPARSAAVLLPAQRSVALDSTRMIGADPWTVVALGQGAVDLEQLEDPSSQPASSRRPKQRWAALAGPLTHGLSSRIVIDRVDDPDPVIRGADAVRSGWDAYCASNAATIAHDDPMIAGLYRSALTRVALSRSNDPIDAALIAAVDGSLSDRWPTDGCISRQALRKPATARLIAFVVKRWVCNSDREAAEWSESAAACLALGAAALETLQRHGEPVDPAAASWLALLASELDQSAETVRSIATAGAEHSSSSCDTANLSSSLLSGWDDRLVERLDRARNRFGRFPEGFVADTARPLGRIDHDATSAAVVALIESMLCTQWPADLVQILPAIPEAWVETPVEVHGLNLSMGRLSFALRWHDDRPALLWELDRSGGKVDSLRVRCGLDETFEGHGDNGEVLLS